MTPTPLDAPAVRALCEAARQGDVSRVLRLFFESLDTDVVLHPDQGVTTSPAVGDPPAGLLRGAEQVRLAVERAGEFVEFTRIEVEWIGVGGDCLVVFLHSRWRAEAFAGRALTPPPDRPMAQVWRFRHGRIVEIRPFSFDQPTIPLP